MLYECSLASFSTNPYTVWYFNDGSDTCFRMTHIELYFADIIWIYRSWYPHDTFGSATHLAYYTHDTADSDADTIDETFDCSGIAHFGSSGNFLPTAADSSCMMIDCQMVTGNVVNNSWLNRTPF